MTVQKDPDSDRFSFLFSNGIEIKGTSNEFTIFFKNEKQADDHLKQMKSFFETSKSIAAPAKEDRPLLGLPAPKPVAASSLDHPTLGSPAPIPAAVLNTTSDPALNREALIPAGTLQVPPCEPLTIPSINHLWNSSPALNISSELPKAIEKAPEPVSIRNGVETAAQKKKEKIGPGLRARFDEMTRQNSELDAELAKLEAVSVNDLNSLAGEISAQKKKEKVGPGLRVHFDEMTRQNSELDAKLAELEAELVKTTQEAPGEKIDQTQPVAEKKDRKSDEQMDAEMAALGLI
jgi:hypothetical protein